MHHAFIETSMEIAMNTHAGIIPTFRYRNSAAMVDWLVDAFGFAVKEKFMDGDAVGHAELTFANAIIMVGQARDDMFGKLVGGPGETGGKSVYLAIADADSALERARKAGAQILEGPTDRDYGSREFICRDPEGNIWCLGTYWPKAG
jgi:uncharacterized glyoxalase superfamily protein PhnB